MSETTPGKPAKKRPAAPPAPPAMLSPLDLFVEDATRDPMQAIMAMFWRERMTSPGAYVEITEQDLTGFKACTQYLEVTPMVIIHRPGAIEATAARTGKDGRIIPARPARPPKDYVVIQMVDQDGNQIVPVENTVENHQQSQRARYERGVIDGALDLGNQLQSQVQGNTISNDTILRAVEALRIMAAKLR